MKKRAEDCLPLLAGNGDCRGIRIAFRHIEALREAGIDAVIATPGAEPPCWFETVAPMIDVSQAVAGDEILVFPENHYGMLQAFAA